MNPRFIVKVALMALFVFYFFVLKPIITERLHIADSVVNAVSIGLLSLVFCLVVILTELDERPSILKLAGGMACGILVTVFFIECLCDINLLGGVYVGSHARTDKIIRGIAYIPLALAFFLWVIKGILVRRHKGVESSRTEERKDGEA